MALTSAQICELARKIAKVPGYQVDSGRILNSVLSDLCQNYDLEICKVTQSFNMNTVVPATGVPANALSATWLRSKPRDIFYTIDGVPYFPTQLAQEEFDRLVLSPGLQSYPYFFFVDTSVSPNQMYFWQPPSGAFPVTARYYQQMADIVSPETDASVPWFPNQNYLITAVAGRLMQEADDDRAGTYMSDQDPQGAPYILRKYLMMMDDRGTIPHRVTLDPRFFRPSWQGLKNTKTIGW